MAGIAKITLVGNLGRDPETRYTPNGKMNVTFTMAVSRRFNDQSGQQQERTNWYRVTAWGGLAETLDRSRNSVVRRVEVRERLGALRVNVFALGDAELEVWAANRQLPALESALERPAKIVAHHIEETEEPERPGPKRPNRKTAA